MALSKADFNNINVTPAASKKLKWNASANGFETGDVGGSMVLLSTQTASGSANLSFTSGIDSTYKEYVFKFINMHCAAADGGPHASRPPNALSLTTSIRVPPSGPVSVPSPLDRHRRAAPPRTCFIA